MRGPVMVYIGLGANLGQPRAAVQAAMDAIAKLEGLTLVARSSLYGSAPLDAGGGDYVNAVVQVQTRLAPLSEQVAEGVVVASVAARELLALFARSEGRS